MASDSTAVSRKTPLRTAMKRRLRLSKKPERTPFGRCVAWLRLSQTADKAARQREGGDERRQKADADGKRERAHRRGREQEEHRDGDEHGDGGIEHRGAGTAEADQDRPGELAPTLHLLADALEDQHAGVDRAMPTVSTMPAIMESDSGAPISARAWRR
jgi:hypothetical protein